MTKTELVEKELRRVYPKALSYTDAWRAVLAGCGAINYDNKHGGTAFRTLVRNNRAKQIAPGFYSWIPQ